MSLAVVNHGGQAGLARQREHAAEALLLNLQRDFVVARTPVVVEADLAHRADFLVASQGHHRLELDVARRAVLVGMPADRRVDIRQLPGARQDLSIVRPEANIDHSHHPRRRRRLDRPLRLPLPRLLDQLQVAVGVDQGQPAHSPATTAALSSRGKRSSPSWVP